MANVVFKAVTTLPGTPIDGEIVFLKSAGDTGFKMRIGSSDTTPVYIPLQIEWANILSAPSIPTVVDSSETAKGIIEIATQSETNTGSDDVRAVTPLKLKVNTESKFVRFDASQSLSGPQQAQARTNIGAISLSEVTLAWVSKAW